MACPAARTLRNVSVWQVCKCNKIDCEMNARQSSYLPSVHHVMGHVTRDRSSSTSTSVFIIKSVFENLSVKKLSILIAINVYNHYMSEIDTANQYQADFT